MKKLFFSLLIMFSVSLAAQTEVLGIYNSKTEAQESDNIAKVETKDDGINFDDWELDFNNSIPKLPEECKGQNCQFKKKQALDPSLDF